MDSKATTLAFQQCNDILRLQEEICNILQEKLNQQQPSCQEPREEDYGALKEALQAERVCRQEVCCELERERDRTRLVESELAILRRQLDREKTTFEDAFGLLKSRALTDSPKAEDLLAKCSALEALCAQKDEEIKDKEQTIVKLQQQLRTVEGKHRRELMELQVRAQQDAYVARHLGRQGVPRRREKKKQT